MPIGLSMLSSNNRIISKTLWTIQKIITQRYKIDIVKRPISRHKTWAIWQRIGLRVWHVIDDADLKADDIDILSSLAGNRVSLGRAKRETNLLRNYPFVEPETSGIMGLYIREWRSLKKYMDQQCRLQGFETGKASAAHATDVTAIYAPEKGVKVIRVTRSMLLFSLTSIDDVSGFELWTR